MIRPVGWLRQRTCGLRSASSTRAVISRRGIRCRPWTQFSTRAPDGAFSPPAYLSNGRTAPRTRAWRAIPPPVTLSRAGEKVRYSPEVGIDGSGRAIAVWLSARDGGSVQARVYEDAPLPVRPIAPGVSGLRVSPAAFRAARSGPATTPPRAGRGTRVSYALNVAASLRFGVERASSGRRAGGRCAVARSANRGRPRCTRYVRGAGRFARDRAAGRDRFTFTGRVAGRTLAPGRYRLVVVPTAAGLDGATARARFSILQ